MPQSKYAGVLDAMRSIQAEGDLWHLADALVKVVPNGVRGFQDIIDEATNAGVVGKMSVHTLRLYRDNAKHWPPSTRVAKVSFTAHRQAATLGQGTTIEGKMLRDISSNLGPSKVTVAEVKKAIAAKTGGKMPTAAASTRKSGTRIDALADLAAGGTQLIAAIHASTPSATLDQLQDGLNKVTAHVEQLRMRAARTAKKAGAKKVTAPAAPAPATVRPTPTATTSPTPTRPGKKSLRGL